MVTRTRLNVTTYDIRTLPVLFKKPWPFHYYEQLVNVFMVIMGVYRDINNL
jgi:hypothetical protein